LEGMFSS